MTKKLYYENAYIKEFDSKILSVTEVSDGFDVILDATAFFPEEGGQASDRGYIDGVRVNKVYELDGVIHHLSEASPTNESVHCTIDFDERFEKMQCHTAEHILCGFIHRLHGLSNVGFHLGDDEVTFDVDGVLSREELDEIESLANQAVFANVEITTTFPTVNELQIMEYRSKLDITDGVRIVKIGEYDSCACCAPHVAYSGEVGLIKILDFMKHRGGTRIWMVAGKRALLDYRKKYENIKKISALTSTPQHETAAALEKYISDAEAVKQELKLTKLRLAEHLGMSIDSCDGNLVKLLPDFSIPELISFANEAVKKVKGILVLLAGNEKDYKYVIASNSENLKNIITDINLALNGKGGGKPNMMQGSFAATLSEIENCFIS